MDISGNLGKRIVVGESNDIISESLERIGGLGRGMAAFVEDAINTGMGMEIGSFPEGLVFRAGAFRGGGQKLRPPWRSG